MARNEPIKPAPLEFSPRLRSLKSGRTTMARILREYAAGRIDNDSMRTWCYAMATFLNYAKTETEMNILDELASIKKRLNEIEKGKTNESTRASLKRIK